MSDWSGSLRVVQGENCLCEMASGVAADRAVTTSTRFQAGSISKQVIAVTILQQVERSRLSLHDPIGRWVPDRPDAWQAMSLHQLLSHTSGLGHWGDVPGLDILGSPPPTRSELDALVNASLLLRPPGRGFSYSGIGFLLAVQVLERALDENYAELAQASVFGPFGMSGTTSGVFPLGRDDVAAGHRGGTEISVAPLFTTLPGTGDLWSTTTDLCAFSLALEGDTLLSPWARTAMAGEHGRIPPDGDASSSITTRTSGYGSFLGSVAGRPARLHVGDNPGYRSLLAWLPLEDVHVAILTNDDAVSMDVPVRAALEGLDAAPI